MSSLKPLNQPDFILARRRFIFLTARGALPGAATNHPEMAARRLKKARSHPANF